MIKKKSYLTARVVLAEEIILKKCSKTVFEAILDDDILQRQIVMLERSVPALWQYLSSTTNVAE